MFFFSSTQLGFWCLGTCSSFSSSSELEDEFLAGLVGSPGGLEDKVSVRGVAGAEAQGGHRPCRKDSHGQASSLAFSPGAAAGWTCQGLRLTISSVVPFSQGGKEYLMRAHLGLPSVEAEDKEGKPHQRQVRDPLLHQPLASRHAQPGQPGPGADMDRPSGASQGPGTSPGSEG